MSAYDIDEFYVHTAVVETFLGISPTTGAKSYSAPTNIIGYFEQAAKLDRGKDTLVVVAKSRFYTYPVNAPAFAQDSRVTINGQVALVVAVNIFDSGALDLPDNAEVLLV